MNEQFDMSPSALRARAQLAARRLAEQAAERAAARIQAQAPADGALLPSDRNHERVLLPGAATSAKEAIMKDDNDNLGFLSPPPSPRPDGVPLDDSSMSAPTPEPAAPVADPDPAAGGLAARERAERDEDALEFLRTIRAMTVDQLLDLRRLDTPPLVLSAAVIEQMLAWLVRVLSFGLLRGTNALANAVAARVRMQELAVEELTRRRRTPESQADKRKALATYIASLRKRDDGLGDRASARSAPDGHAAERARRRRAELLAGHERAFDRYQVELDLPTIALRRREVAAAEAAERLIEDEVPAAMGMVMLPRSKAEALASRADRVVRLARAARLRRIADMELQLFLLRVERATDERIASDAAAAAGVVAREVEERALISAELGNLPAELRGLDQLLDRERIGRAAQGFIEAASAPVSAESAAEVEAERAALRRLLAKGA